MTPATTATFATAADPLALPTACGPPPLRGRLRAVPEDFRVEEVLGFEPDGTGGHALLRVEKRGANTGWVAAQLARAAGVAARDVGWSGHKDRDAVTCQSFTLPWPATNALDPLASLAGEGYRVVAAARHARKLRPGSHRANRFEIRVREIAGDLAELERRLDALARRGVPSYFGPQRFGRSGANLGRARAWAAGGAAPRDRAARGFALSAARSALFNAVLAERVRRGDWERLLPGEAVMLDGKRSYFHAAEVDATLDGRCAALDLHPSGPLWGRGPSPATREALAVETAVVSCEPALCALLEGAGLGHERRSLRLPVRDLHWRIEDDQLLLAFELPRGTFATAVLHELVHDAWTGEEAGDD